MVNMKPPLHTSELEFIKNHETHFAFGKRYSLDAVIDIIIARPRLIDPLPLDNWYCERLKGDFGGRQSLLISANGIEHEFVPKVLTKSKPFPVILCQRGRRTIIVDGIHRIVKAVRAKKKFFPAIYITYAELKQCEVQRIGQRASAERSDAHVIPTK